MGIRNYESAAGFGAPLHAHGKTDIGAHFEHLAFGHLNRAGFDAARLLDVARLGAVHRSQPGIARLAVVQRYRRRLAQRFAARLGIGFRAQNHMAARHAVGVKPPVIGFRQFGAQIIVIGVGGAGEDSPIRRAIRR